MKKLSLLILVYLNTSFLTAQINNVTEVKMDTSLIAINMEQIIEKAGFENLMKLTIESNKAKNNTENKAAIRKAMAAIYGAGIDFKRKALYYINTPRIDIYNPISYKNYSGPRMSFILPVANKQVFEQNMLTIINKEHGSKKDETQDHLAFKQRGTYSWLQMGKTLMVLSDKEFIITMMPFDLSSFSFAENMGTIIKRDTIITPMPVMQLDEFSTKKEMKPTIEIDKLVNGKIKRVYQYKKVVDKKISRTEEVAVAPIEEIREDVKMIEGVKEEAISVVADSTMVAVVEETKIEATKATRDTLQYPEWVNDSTKVTIYYVPYTDEERRAADKKSKEDEKQKQTTFALNFIENIPNFLPYNLLNSDYKIAFESTADIVSCGKSMIPYKQGVSSLFLGSGLSQNPFQSQNSSYLSFFNFDKGAINVTMQAGCCGDYNEAISKMYLPVTSFWPKELGTTNLGMVKLNMNMTEWAGLYNKIIPAKVKEEMTSNEISLDKLANLFSGEIAGALNSTVTTSGRKEPKFLVAIKLKDAAAAVAMFNKLGSQSLKGTQNYRFDESGQYLLLTTEKNVFANKATIPATVANAVTIAGKGGIYVEVGKLIKAMTKTSKLNKPETQAMINTFGKLSFENTSSEDGMFSSTMKMELGDKNKNALTSIMELWKKMNEKSNSVYPPLSSKPN